VIDSGALAGPARPPKEDSDGSWTGIAQRPLSRRLAGRLGDRPSADAITGLAAAIGLVAAGCAALGQPILAAILIQVFGVLSCLDGEVARRRHEASTLGDFLDTLSDRLVEVGVIAGSATLMVRQGVTPAASLAASMALLGGVLMLVVSSEKYRSSFGDYPKRLRERGWTWVSAGSDARLLVVSLGLVASIWSTDALLVLTAALALCVWLNVAWRVIVVVRTQGGP
jgi:phosphatidylglycerophosphate synthase